MFYDSNPWVFAIIDLNQHAFLVLKGVTPTFSNLGILLKIDIKNCPLLGKLLSVWRTVSVLPKSAQSAQSAQTVENSNSFSNVSYTWYKSLEQWNLEIPTILGDKKRVGHCWKWPYLYQLASIYLLLKL